MLFYSRERTIKNAIDNTITRMHSVPSHDMLSWCAYFLECIESDFGEERLAEIRLLIDDRFDDGGW